ncbi:MAG TPA: amino acid--[acyl-carrier-protein] ligase [Polyangiaceae bacterium]|nr:amino acid--[acyl-carrier-protein] ligase [Polyangiaceae bacterium]
MGDMESQVSFLNELFEAQILIPSGVPGLYGRSATFENILNAFDAFVSRAGAPDRPSLVRFPPLIDRATFQRSGYMKNMPQLAGTVHSFMGGQPEHVQLIQELESGADWSHHQKMTDVVLTPAACYPLYPSQSGEIGDTPRTFDVQSYCFRHEPSQDPARMQVFRMREFVQLGSAEAVRSFRSSWFDRGQELFARVGLEVHAAPANDPFFGRTGRMLAANQREQELKYEMVVPIASEAPTAIMSLNYHQDLFGSTFGIRRLGNPAHTACVGFGLERITLALLKKHGLQPATWPEAVRTTLFPNGL